MHVLIQVIISLIAVYIVLSIVNSLLIEGIFKLFNQRGRFLKSHIFHFFEGGIQKKKGFWSWLFILEHSEVPEASKTSKIAEEPSGNSPDHKSVANQLYDHLLIKSFSSKRNHLPNTIATKVFSSALMELLFEIKKSGNQTIIKLRDNVSSSLPEKLRETIEFIMEKSDRELDMIQKEIEEIYEKYMEQVSAWYKARIKIFLLMSGLVLATMFNIDSIVLFNAFFTDAELRQEYYEKGLLLDKYRDSIQVDSSAVIGWLENQNIDTIDKESLLEAVNHSISIPGQKASLGLVNLPIGWDNNKNKWYRPSPNTWLSSLFYHSFLNLAILFKITGILLTAIALSSGSTYWFEVLRKAVRFGRR